MALQWRNVDIVSARDATLDFGRDWQFLQDVENFCIGCKSLPGVTCIQLTQEMSSLGRKVYYEGSNFELWLSSFHKDGETRKRFDALVECGCQACLGCLHRGGKLPKGSPVPKAC